MAKDKEGEKDKAAEKDATDAKTESADGEAAKPAGRFGFLSKLKINLSRKTLLFVVAPAAAVLLIAIGAWLFLFSGGEEHVAAAEGHGAAGAHGEAAAAHAGPHPVFYDIPDILVNVSAGDKPAFLKLSVSLELEGNGEEAKAAIEPVVPRVVDQLQTYLRELRVEDLNGSAAMFRLKEEMLRRINLAVEPLQVKDVLFREMIVQ